DSCASFGCPVKTRPASAARPSLLYRTCKLILASLFQGAVSGMKDSCEEDIPVCESSRQIKIRMKIEVKGFIFLCAGYSTHKRFVLGGAGCAAYFVYKTLVSGKTLVAYLTDGCSPVDKGQVGPDP